MGSSEQRLNYRGLKLIERVVKVMECVVKGLFRQRDKIDEMQCDFMSVHGSKDAVFIVCHLQEKHITANYPFYMVSIDLEEAIDQVPQDIIWRAGHNIEIGQWLVRLL